MSESNDGTMKEKKEEVLDEGRTEGRSKWKEGTKESKRK